MNIIQGLNSISNYLIFNIKKHIIYTYVYINTLIDWAGRVFFLGKNIAVNEDNVLIPYTYNDQKYIYYLKPNKSSPVLSACLFITGDNQNILREFLQFFDNVGAKTERKDREIGVDISKFIRTLAGPCGNFHGENITLKECLLLIISEKSDNMEFFDDNLEYVSIRLEVFNNDFDTKKYDLNDFIVF